MENLAILSHSQHKAHKRWCRVRRAWTEKDVAFLQENYHLLSPEEIVDRLRRSEGAIKQKAFKLGLTKFPDDISFFTNWSEESAYFVGLFAADGYAQVRKGKGTAISITLKDRELLERIQVLIGRGNLYHVKQWNTYRYELNGKNLYEYLCTLFGHNVQRKSRTLQWPCIPDRYVRHFIRGYCDGDGHIGFEKRGTPQVRFYCGSEIFRDAVLTNVQKFTGIIGTVSLAINNVHLALYTGIKAICLAQWLYSDCKLSLERKQKVATELAASRRRYNRASITPKMQRMFSYILG